MEFFVWGHKLSPWWIPEHKRNKQNVVVSVWATSSYRDVKWCSEESTTLRSRISWRPWCPGGVKGTSKVLWQRKERCVLMLMLQLFVLHIKLLENFCNVLHVTFIASLWVWTYFDRGMIYMIVYEKKCSLPHWFSDKAKTTQPKSRTLIRSVYCQICDIYEWCVEGWGVGLDSMCLSYILEFIKLKQFMELGKWILKFCDNALTVVGHYCSLSGWLCKRKQYLGSRPFNPNPLII